MEATKFKKGFKKGYVQVRIGDIKEVQRELLKALEIDNMVSFSRYLNGRLEPKASNAEAVEQVFAKRGITEVWGGADE